MTRTLAFAALLGLLVAPEAGAGRKKKRRKDKLPRIEAPAPAVPPPGDGLSTWEEAMSQAGSAGERFDLEALAYVITTFTIEADLSLLDTLGPDKRERLLKHLAADPRWRLGEHHGALVAFRRVEDEHGWSAAPDGYHVSDDEVWRSAIRLTPWKDDAPMRTSPLASRGSLTDPTMKVKAFSLPEQKWEAVALVWEDDDLAFELFEARKETTLERATSELVSIPSVVDIATLEDTDEHGYSPPGMPAGHPSDAEGVAVRYAAGVLDVRAWVRAPGMGTTWVRLYDSEGQPWQEDAVASATREIVGWSTDAASFALQGSTTVSEAPPQPLYAELWHAPTGSSRAERLGAWPVDLQ